MAQDFDASENETVRVVSHLLDEKARELFQAKRSSSGTWQEAKALLREIFFPPAEEDALREDLRTTPQRPGVATRKNMIKPRWKKKNFFFLKKKKIK